MESELQAIASQNSDPLEKLVKSLNRVKDGLNSLQLMVKDLPMDEPLEILLFKEIKPAFYCHQIFATEIYTIETGFPFGGTDKQVTFLEGELDYVEHFFARYPFLYHYYKLRMSEMDGIYFLRNGKPDDVTLPHGPDRDPLFSTACDYLFAKFRAFDMLKEWLQEKISYLKGNPAKNVTSLTDDLRSEELIWTGDAINLAELGYGLVLSGQLNHGQASIAQVFRWLEEKFRITIGVPQKKFGELRARKRLSRTKFIDELRDQLIRKMDSEDTYQPSRPGKGFGEKN